MALFCSKSPKSPHLTQGKGQSPYKASTRLLIILPPPSPYSSLWPHCLILSTLFTQALTISPSLLRPWQPCFHTGPPQLLFSARNSLLLDIYRIPILSSFTSINVTVTKRNFLVTMFKIAVTPHHPRGTFIPCFIFLHGTMKLLYMCVYNIYNPFS